MIQPGDRVVIVGAGCFGASAALHFLDDGFKDVVVLDRAETLPAPDAASNDLNKGEFWAADGHHNASDGDAVNTVVRTSYSDIFYTKLAREAIARWKDTDAWGGAYHESGVVVLGDAAAPQDTYANQAYANDASAGAPAEPLRTPREIHDAVLEHIPNQDRTGSQPHTKVALGTFAQNAAGYLSREGGWVEAGRATELALGQVTQRGARVLPGKDVCAIERCEEPGGREQRTRVVRCRDGSMYEGELVVLATGAWTASGFPTLSYVAEKCLATGQCIATIQLTQDEANLYRKCPVVLNFSTGFYIFPPNATNTVKMAIHSAGYTHKQETSNPNPTQPAEPHVDVPRPAKSSPASSPSPSPISTPRTVSNAAQDGLRIPTAALTALRTHLHEVYPDLATKPFSGTRMCWYTDSPDGDWVIGFHPDDPSLLLATGGSGHAFKFLPVIGHLVVEAAHGRLDSALAAKFAVERESVSVDQSRIGREVAQELLLDQLCNPEDLLPGAA
ncbi:hypothetical protein HGRIS_001993 [Hohenbuehelia grisea]|uniref:FAD dependent oxidoreductase domain-containing protein n=1 Tax=Hohenbuehelia grisea TaxID=104357 RepID=A0ABR3JJK1_9AGAR